MIEHLPLALKIGVPLIAWLTTSKRSVRLKQGERYRVIVRFTPPLEGQRQAWAQEVTKDYPGATDVTVTARAGSTLVGWAYRSARSHPVEPGVTRYRLGRARGILVRIERLGEVEP